MRSQITVIHRQHQQGGVALPAILGRLLPCDVQAQLARLPCRRIEEIRLRVGCLCAVTDERGNNLPLYCDWSRERMDAFLQGVCDGSRYSLAHSIDRGYICPGSGVRVGLCGLAGMRVGNGEDASAFCVQRVDAVCIRLPGHFEAVGQGILPTVRACLPRGVLFYAPPGVGKTTLIRALAQALSSGERPLRTVLVDSRRELDDGSFSDCRTLDILAGYPKEQGIEIAVRTLGAQVILCDELGASEVPSVLSAAMYGVPLIATAHALHVRQLRCRAEIRALSTAGVFAAYVGLARAGVGEDYRYTITPDGEDLPPC